MVDLVVPQPRDVETSADLVGRNLRLSPVTPSDYSFLYDIAVNPKSLHTWRFRGAPPDMDTFVQSLWQGVLVQYLLRDASSNARIGLVSAYNADLRNGIVWLSFCLSPDQFTTGTPYEALAIFGDYLFSFWPIRKVYLELLEFTYKKVASGEGKYFEVEGCLRDYDYFDGDYLHRYQLAVNRGNVDRLKSLFSTA